jgi:hypothetical protein
MPVKKRDLRVASARTERSVKPPKSAKRKGRASTGRSLIRILTLLVRGAVIIKALLRDAKAATRRRAERWLKEFETGLTDKPLKWF